MKKVVIKELDRTFLGIDLMLYCIYVVMGYILIGFPEVEILNPMEYSPVLFFMFGFFSLIAYFLNRRVGNYEYLFLGLINVMVATFVLVHAFFGNDALLMALAISIYSLSIILNKSYYLVHMLKNKDINFYPKTITVILLIFIGLLTVSPIFAKYAAANMILGYYLMAFGLVNLLEVLLTILIRNPRLDNALTSIFGLAPVKTTKKKVVLKEIKKKKIKDILVNYIDIWNKI
jgi:uncharacterized membrane protein HdeD (DUF308 family)